PLPRAGAVHRQRRDDRLRRRAAVRSRGAPPVAAGGTHPAALAADGFAPDAGGRRLSAQDFFAPILPSVPAFRRRMFSAWRQNRIALIASSASTAGTGPRKIRPATGASAAADSAATEE